MKIKDSYWFTQLGNPKIIGVVYTEDEFSSDRYYIGEASGNDTKNDEIYIAETGANFPLLVGRKLFNIRS